MRFARSQDFNIFVQVVGRKRFTLFLPGEHERVHMFPRIHPLWHKSQVSARSYISQTFSLWMLQLDFDSPDLSRYPDYTLATAYTAELEPGDVLYVPPYCWHQVRCRSWNRLLANTCSAKG